MIICNVIMVVSTAKVQKIWEQFTTSSKLPRISILLFRLQKYKKFESNSQRPFMPKTPIKVVSTAKVQKIWEQFTTKTDDFQQYNKLFRLQKYKKFESNSQHRLSTLEKPVSCFDCKSTKNLRAIHNHDDEQENHQQLFRLQKYKKFESNSQLERWQCKNSFCCFDCKSTKNLRAIHNCRRSTVGRSLLFRLQKYKKFESNSQLTLSSFHSLTCCFDCKSTKNLRAIHNSQLAHIQKPRVVSTAKVQKIWEQFTTVVVPFIDVNPLFRLQKYKKFESNSQPWKGRRSSTACCFDCKSTKNLRAIHNAHYFTNDKVMLFRLQKYKKFESNSQLIAEPTKALFSCFDCKSTKNLRAIHNSPWWYWRNVKLFRLQKYKKFESNSQRIVWFCFCLRSCFDCKSTKNLRAIHNIGEGELRLPIVVSTAKVQKIWEQFTTGSSGYSAKIGCFDCKSTKNLRAIHNPTAQRGMLMALFRLQKYKKFESNSQRLWLTY